MKPSNPLSLKALAAKIHHPLPLTPRESQKLLSLLTSSFRSNLDKEYADPKPTTNSKPMDIHIQEILSNPLLKRPVNQGKGHLAAAVARDAASAKGISLIQSLLNDPVEFLQDQITCGQATLETARVCLETYQKNLTTFLPQTNTSSKSENISVVSITLKWLWSSGLEESLEFLNHAAFMNKLMPLLVTEGKTSHVWNWFTRLQERVELSVESADNARAESIKAMAFLLRTLMWARMRQPLPGFNEALEDYFKAQAQLERLDQAHARSILLPGIAVFSGRLLRQASSHIEPALYDQLMASSCLRQDGRNVHALKARLAVLAPKPDPTLALQYIRSISTTGSKPYLFYELCLRTMEVLVDQDNQQEARRLLTYLEEKFPAESGRLSSHTSISKSPSMDESPHRNDLAWT